MFNKLKPKSEFSRNALTLMTGTMIAQAIPMPSILTGMYTPEVLAIWNFYMNKFEVLTREELNV